MVIVSPRDLCFVCADTSSSLLHRVVNNPSNENAPSTRHDAPIDPVMFSSYDGRARPSRPVLDDCVGTVVLAGGRMRLRIRVPETGDAGQTGVTLTSSGDREENEA